ncbi:MAG: prepilin-type N-terminal cleavage/methylation domain-containing protein [Candidatus Omnitrophica bacterium]|nr:prepilin-type N-terminal cleavage/methylation domain-containing protein [Candidatus Omnitrophota bacterium]
MNQKGMTLIEVLIAVLILSGGLVTVYRALLSSLQTLKYAETRLEAQWIMSEKVWAMQDYVYRMKRLPPSDAKEAKDELLLMGRKAVYNTAINVLSQGEDFFRVQYDLRWTFQGKNKNITRTGYLVVPHTT